MKIQGTINGMKFNIELLPDELEEAYFEQQKKFDIEDVITLGEAFSNAELQESYGCSYQELLNHKEDIAALMRKYIDKYDMEWTYAREEAVRDVMYKERTAELAT